MHDAQRAHDGSDLTLEQIVAGIFEELDKRRRNRVAGSDPTWWPAIEIAERFGIRPRGSDDSRKRGVRQVMTVFRARYPDFVACTHGYALAAGAEDLTRYAAVLKANGLTQVVRAGEVKRSETMDDMRGQLRLAQSTKQPAAETPAGMLF